ncbi:hypothetical protein ANN_26761 [Periplaneta americana]|uniref:Tc1-like transposase DDE domain-containing protein n=1 Tax=Periplaneta americana TaxID=6978 RepID=A0ABQ8RZ85_PERAM|nr:hypothetical protein ANN_26761 [Periplaneta americana]
MAVLCEGGNEPPGSLKASNTESYPAFAHVGLRETPGKNLNQITCPKPGFEPGPPAFAARRADRYSTGCTTSKSWVDTTIASASQARKEGLTTGNKMPSARGGRIILVHTGNENGFSPGAQLVYHGKKNGDYHDEMTSVMYEKYFADKLLSKLPANSVIVLDNVSVHSRKDEKIPVKRKNKAEIKSWLVSKAIPVGEDRATGDGGVCADSI